MGSFDSAREIEIYLRRCIIPDISWNPPWNGISSITEKRAWVELWLPATMREMLIAMLKCPDEEWGTHVHIEMWMHGRGGDSDR